jgi:uncharacterized membrane protein
MSIFRLLLFLTTHLENVCIALLRALVYVHLSIHLKGFVNSMKIGAMIIMALYASTFFFLAQQDSGTNAYAQENNTLILEDIRAILRNQQHDISSIKNMTAAEIESNKNITAAQLEVLNDISVTSTKLAAQGAYSSLSVFFLGIGLVIFGLRLTSRVAPQIGRSMTIMVWALTIPVIILVAIYQHGLITGNPLITVIGEPYLLISFLLYIPIAIVVFLLLEQKGIVQHQASHTSRQIHEMEKLIKLRDSGEISEEEFQRLKTALLSGT